MAGLAGVSTTPRQFDEHLTLVEDLEVPCPTRISDLMRDAKSTWKTCGWTYQEGKCSRRCIFFSKSEINFACRESTRNELIPHVRLSDMLQKNVLLTRSELFYDLLNDFERDVFNYSGRTFTFPSDRMNAFRGILMRSSKKSWWGMLLESFDNGICGNLALSAALSWQVCPDYDGIDEQVMTDSPIRNGCFPSWSWTNINRTIHWNESQRGVFRKSISGYPTGFPEFSVSVKGRTMNINDFKEHTGSKMLPEDAGLMVIGYVIRLYLPKGRLSSYALLRRVSGASSNSEECKITAFVLL